MSEGRNVVPPQANLHSYTKLGIAYLGIISGLATLGLTFYVIASTGEALGAVMPPPEAYFATVGFFLLLIVLSILGLWQLRKGKRLGAYLAFASLAISIFAPYSNQMSNAPLAPIWWVAIPNIAVGFLILKSLKTLH